MRVFKFDLYEVFGEEKKCSHCNWDTSLGYVVARGEVQAEELLKEGIFSCGSCLADEIAEKDFVVAKKFHPEDFPDIAFPNWLTREEAEEHLGRKLDDEDWEDLKDWVESELIMDEVIEKIWEAVDSWESSY